MVYNTIAPLMLNGSCDPRDPREADTQHKPSPVIVDNKEVKEACPKLPSALKPSGETKFHIK